MNQLARQHLIEFPPDNSSARVGAPANDNLGPIAANDNAAVTHMPFGPASSWTYGNGVTDTRTFDLDYRMTSVTDKSRLDYTLNPAPRGPANGASSFPGIQVCPPRP